MKRFLATTALLMLPIAAIADGMDEDRIKELVLEAIRENPGIVFEAAQLFEQQQQALQERGQQHGHVDQLLDEIDTFRMDADDEPKTLESQPELHEDRPHDAGSESES